MCRFLFQGDFLQVHARNEACKDAIRLGTDWLMFIDSDADFPVDTLQRLKDCDADVACADMWSRNVPSFRTVMRVGEPDPETGLKPSHPVPGNPTGVEDVDVCGMHCTLIRTSLLKRMKPPWFFAVEHGEDAGFCFKAKAEADAVIRCDFGVVAGHWGVARIAGQDWSRDAANQPMKVANIEMAKRAGIKNLREEGEM